MYRLILYSTLRNLYEERISKYSLWTGAALYARYRLGLFSNKLYGGGGEGASGYVLSEWGGAVTVQ